MSPAPNPRGAEVERRRSHRRSIARPAVFVGRAPDDQLCRGVAVDISVTGLRIDTRTPAHVGACLEIELHPPNTGDNGATVVMVRGDVMHLSTLDDGHTAMGVHLTAAPPPEQFDVVSNGRPEAMRALLTQIGEDMRNRDSGSPSPLAALETLRTSLPLAADFRTVAEPVGTAEGSAPRKHKRGLLAVLALFLLLLLGIIAYLGPLLRDRIVRERLLQLQTTATTEAMPPQAVDAAEAPPPVQSPEVMLGQAQSLLATGQPEAALKHFTELTENSRARPLQRFIGRLGQAQTLAAQERHAKAQDAAAAALAMPVSDIPPAWRHAAEALHATLAAQQQARTAEPEPRAMGTGAEADVTSQPEAAASAPPPIPRDNPGTPVNDEFGLAPEVASAPPPIPRDNPGAPVTDEFGLASEEELNGMGGPASEDVPMEGVVLVVSRADYLMAVYVDGTLAETFPVGLGRGGATPTGQFAIANKIRNPDWYNRGNVIPSGDPRNPLGNAWMGLGRDGRATSYGIHPTEAAESIGANESRGCVRMRPADADVLFGLCAVGTPVIIRP